MNTLPATVAAKPVATFYAFPKTEEKNVVPFTEAVIAKELGDAIAEYDKHVGSAIRAAIRIGHAAMVARDMIEDGKWTKWLEANFPAFSVQWARRCIQTAELYNALEDKCTPQERETIIDRMTSVEKAAAFLGTVKTLQLGESPLSALETQQASKPAVKTGRPAKAAKLQLAPKAAKGAPVLEGAQRAKNFAELQEWDDELTQREQELAERIAAVEAREAACAERERQLTLAASTGDKPSDFKWPATAAQKAEDATVKPARKRGDRSGSAQTPPVDTNPAPEAKNASGDDTDVIL